MGGTRWSLLVCLLALCVLHAVPGSAVAHPIPKGAHDRVITVRLTRNAVVVEYRLEVDQWTIVFQDLPAVGDKVDLSKLQKAEQFYEAFSSCYAPILADNLLASLDEKPLTFCCIQRRYELVKPEDNLRCDYVFEARWDLIPGHRHRFQFKESNYEMEPGLINLSLDADSTVILYEKVEPDAELKARPVVDHRPGDALRLRTVAAVFARGAVSQALLPKTRAETDPTVLSITPPAGNWSESSLKDLLLDSDHGFLLMLVLAGCFGAAHALTPGHGKTLVAAYLVGQRGTIWHAVFLGLVTTLTHTGAVLLLALGLRWYFPKTVPDEVQFVLGLLSALLVTGLGAWLFFRRLLGQADHFHIGGGHSHNHGEHGHSHAPPTGDGVGWLSLIVLGVSGGIVPCFDAIVMLLWAIASQRLALALPLLLAFSAGLAAVLVAIGIAVVQLRGFAQSRFGEGRFFQALPLLSAAVILGLGLWLLHTLLQPALGGTTSLGG